MKIKIRPVEVNFYQLLVHDGYDCCPVDADLLCEKVNEHLSFFDIYSRLVTPDDCGSRAFRVAAVPPGPGFPPASYFPAMRVYSSEEARASLPDWLRDIVDKVNLIEVVL